MNKKLCVGPIALLCGMPELAWAQEVPVESGVIDAMNKVFGVHPGFRATHAKGIVVDGSFRGTPEDALTALRDHPADCVVRAPRSGLRPLRVTRLQELTWVLVQAATGVERSTTPPVVLSLGAGVRRSRTRPKLRLAARRR
jgi:hypothetical protein